MSKLLALLFLWVFLPGGLSLKCYQCSGLPYYCQETEQLCFLNQTFCMSQSFTIVENTTIKEWTYKGCSQGLVCNETAYMNQGRKKSYISSQCCTTDFCNTGTYYARVPVAALSCLACEGNNCSAPNLTSIPCSGLQDRCMTITTTTSVNGVSSASMIKGCGTGNLCNRSLEYNSGNGKLYSSISCCGKNNCNSGRNTTATYNETLNGLQCYSCNETGRGECKNASVIGTVKCTGNMTSCFDITGFPRGNTLMRGCSSQDVCRGLSVSMSVQPSQKLFCCSGNLCNNGDITSYFRSSSATAQSNIFMVGMALLLLKGYRTLL
ncbi:urokinase plasminogen activator surface receptor-like [Rhinophrynus dorsalis]